MLNIKKGCFYKDRNDRLVKILSDKLSPFDLYVAMTSPTEPNPANMYFVRSDGYTEDDDRELVKDVTCPVCCGKGQYLFRVGPDEARTSKCDTCKKKGYW